MKIRHFFLPHPETHKKAHLISWKALLIYILFFLCLKFGLEGYAYLNPGVLGVTSKVDKAEIIRLTNVEREKRGVTTVKENEELNAAALEKAKNMFEEDYWAHYSPSGKDPWGFIKGAGYQFIFAGENLARNFYTSQEVVDAWIASPSHRDNLLNTRYKDIGIAVVEGVLKGQKTTLVVQEFGAPSNKTAVLPPSKPAEEQTLSNNLAPTSAAQDVLPVTQSNPPLPAFSLDQYKIFKVTGFSFIAIFAALLLLDLYILKRRGVYRITSRHLPHLIFLGVAANALSNIHPGGIL